METYTLRQASELTGLSYEALRTRVDRGQIRAVKPGRGKARRIPRAELEGAGLSVEKQLATTSQVVSDLLAKLEAQAAELASLRQLEERAGSLAGQLEAERKSRELVEQETHRLRCQIDAAKNARFWQRRRVLNGDGEFNANA
jgi:excisionase family DNA binding protein